MKTLQAITLFTAALAAPAVAAGNDEPCGAGRAFNRHLYAFAYFYNGAPDAAARRVIGNAFAIHAISLSKCGPEAECVSTGRSQWRLLFATAAHVIVEVCKLQKSVKPGTIKLIIPERPDRRGVDSNRIEIGERFCTEYAEAENFNNNLQTVVRNEEKLTSVRTTIADDIRKNSDQWFFSADIDTPDSDIVLPVVVGPLRKPSDNEGIPLRYYAFQNAPADKYTQVEEGVWWTYAKSDYNFTSGERQSVYESEDWTTIKGASGSAVFEVLESENRLRTIGINTRFAFVGCAKAAGITRGSDTNGAISSDTDDTTAMTVADLARCVNDPVTNQRLEGKTTSFVPVLRDLPRLHGEFKKLTKNSGIPEDYTWTRSPELLAALGALVRSRQKATTELAKQEIGKAIMVLARDIPPHEMAFTLYNLANAKKPGNAVSGDNISVSGCSRIEPSFGATQ